MSAESIEARTHELMGLHKEQLARLLARAEDTLGPVDLWAGEQKIEQGTDPVITEVPAASTEPEQLDPETLEPIPPQPPVDNAHVAEGAEQFSPADVQAMKAAMDVRIGDEPAATIEGADAAPADSEGQLP